MLREKVARAVMNHGRGTARTVVMAPAPRGARNSPRCSIFCAGAMC